MSLTSYIENLRERPVHVRKRHSFWWAFSFTAIVFVFWLASFTNITVGSHGATAVAEHIITPGQSLVAGAADFANDVWSIVSGPKKVKFAEVEVLPGKK